MIFSKKFANIVYICLFLLFLLGEYLIGLSDSKQAVETKHKVNKPKKDTKPLLNKNYLHFIKENANISESSITKIFNSNSSDYIQTITLRSSNDIKNIVAMGIDKKYHISNTYLEGYAPFKTNKLWIPLQTIASKKTYQLDNLQYSGYQEIWQSSSQAFKYPRGDCEDHAIALADWLIEMGEDARVVLGKYGKNGHAWVILFKDGKEYILESTQKRNLKKPYLLAKYQTKYKASFMFNRDSFWVLKNSNYSMNYNSNNWIKKTIYVRK